MTTKPATPASPKPKAARKWHATVNLDRLEAASGRWRITTGKASDPLPREVATDPGVRAAVGAWMTAHSAKQQPTEDVSQQLEADIRTHVTTAFRAMPPAAPVVEPVAKSRK